LMVMEDDVGLLVFTNGGVNPKLLHEEHLITEGRATCRTQQWMIW
jgi:hypothetical protein